MALPDLRIMAVIVLGVCLPMAALSQGASQNQPEVHAEPATHFLDIPPRLYRVPMTRADTTPEWLAFSKLVGFSLFEDDRPGLGVNITTERYGLTESQAAELLQAVREVRAEMNDSGPKPRSICNAGISSGPDYLEWWAQFEKEIKAHRQAMVDALVSRVDQSIWEPVIQFHFMQWLGPGDVISGEKMSYQKQIELADYRVWMRQICR